MVQAQGVTSGVPQDAAFLWSLNPPVRDDADLKRSGLRPYQRTVNCSYNDSKKGAKAWTNTLADFLMGMHRTRNGSVTTYGIHAPIAVGDNIELRGNVYHLEEVTHTCTLDEEGNRNFETTLSVSHGMTGDQGMDARMAQGEPTHEAQYITGKPAEFVASTETK
jgi:hypothetical protein